MPSARERGQNIGEVAVDERGRTGKVGLELREALACRGIAIDADQRARRAEPVGDQARVPATAEGAVDCELAGLRVAEGDELRCEDWDVLGWHVGECVHP